MQKNENKESKISNKIKRYPFNGKSSYLIDKFYIIGYNIPTLHKLLFEYNKDNLSKHIIIDRKQSDDDKNKSSKIIQSFTLKEQPNVLNEFTSDFTKDCLDYDKIKQMILPNGPLLYYSEEDISVYLKEIKELDDDEFGEYEENDLFDNDQLKVHTMVFSSNPQAENNSKVSINGFGYIFYKKLKKRKFLSKKIISFYIPIIFSVISEYPYYNGFYKICNQIKYLYNYPKKEVPIEIMISNLIMNTQSPINGDVILSIKPISFLFEQKAKQKEKSMISSKNINIIPEINEEEDQKKEQNGGALMSKTSSDIIYFKDSNYLDGMSKTAKKFMKKNSQILNLDLKSIFKSEIRKEHSPSLRLKEDEFDFADKKKRKTCTAKNMNAFLNKIKTSKKRSNSNYSNYLTDELFPKIKFEFLPGYPLIQYNLAKVLLYTLSPIDIIEIFFYTFLEKDVLFFSKNLQYLSLTINSYLNLNFPLNEEKYYYINASVSYENYINGNSTFVGSTFTTIIGINDSYQPKYITSSNKLKEHLVVDLDKGEIMKVDDKNNKEGTKKNKDLFSLIKRICKKDVKSEKKRNTIIAREVLILFKKLTDINNLLNNNENEIENTDQYNLFKNGDLLDYDNDKNNYIKKYNMEIQDSFYRLIINLCLYFYQNLSIKTDDDDINRNNEINSKKKNTTEMNVIFRDDYKYEEDENKTYTKEELYFLDELRDTMKYESFVYTFIQSYSPIDLYKIPLTFTEEFLSIISRKSSILENNFNFFGMIDQLYGGKINPIAQIDFNPIITMYYKKYKNLFDREINDMNEENILNEDQIKVKYIFDEYKNKNYLKYRDYELDNDILMKYLNLINNFDEDDHNYMLYFSDVLKHNISKEIMVIEIENLIESYSIETNLLTKSDLCCSNIILLFSLSLNFFDSNIDVQAFLGIIFQEFTVFRKYYSYVMNMIYILFSNCLKQKDYSRAHFYLLCYYICVNSLRNLKLVPNESLMNIMKKFNEIDLKKFNENVLEHQNNEKENNQINDEKEEIFKKVELTQNNLFTCYNFLSTQFIRESEILDKINSSVNNDFSIKVDGETILPKIKFKNRILKIDTYFYSQTSMLTQLINIYNKFIVDLNEEHLGYKLLIDCCINILVYMRNCEDFRDKDEIKDIVEIIFFLFLNKLVSITNILSNSG